MHAILRPAVDLDYWRFFAKPTPAWWVGITAEDDHMLLGLGGVYRGVDGRLWCCFAKARGVSGKLLMQKAARTLLGSLQEAGIDAAYAIADETIAGSELWLDRLGFEVTDEMHNDHRIWRWTPAR